MRPSTTTVRLGVDTQEFEHQIKVLFPDSWNILLCTGHSEFIENLPICLVGFLGNASW